METISVRRLAYAFLEKLLEKYSMASVILTNLVDKRNIKNAGQESVSIVPKIKVKLEFELMTCKKSSDV